MTQHTFHIPVLGLGYSIDTPLKVARYGISSVVSIVDDELTERMRKYHAKLNHEPYHPISKIDYDSRKLRITAYLNLLYKLVSDQITALRDYRSALIQAKVLAKKGLWVSEFRIESGLNCGGHTFATEGLLLGPILQEFKDNRPNLYLELLEPYQQALQSKHWPVSTLKPTQLITVQGGIGTAEEHEFLINYYGLDGAGWGSTFLLVPEATNVDETTLNNLIKADESDYYLSNASPLGIPFNNFRKSTAEQQRIERIECGRPGSPCTKKYLCSNTEFTEEPICTASREYQHLKIKQLKSSALSKEQLALEINAVTEKLCLCVGLCNSTYLSCNILKPREHQAVSICPGPNLAYFSGQYSLKEMVDHIYGKENLLNGVNRPNLFIKEFGNKLFNSPQFIFTRP